MFAVVALDFNLAVPNIAFAEKSGTNGTTDITIK